MKLTEMAKQTLDDGYRLFHLDKNNNKVWEEDYEGIFRRACKSFATSESHAQRLYSYCEKDWFRPATPILANAGTRKGLGISCFLNVMGDSREDIADYYRECIFLSSAGGGIGTDASALRSQGVMTSTGNQTSGIIPFLNVADSLTVAISQGTSRRGATAIYLDVSHPEIEAFLQLRKATGSDRYLKTPSLHNAVNIPDAFMRKAIEGGNWDLIDPHTKQVVKTVSARALWAEIMRTRLETGEPYLHFIDTSNAALPKPLKDKGLRINNSNLCSEIYLPTAVDRTAVCCLSSINVEYFDDWKNNENFILDVAEYLDNVLQHFIDTAGVEYKKAVYSASQERSIGIGVMGLHAYYQKNMLPWAGMNAYLANITIFKHIAAKAEEASLFLGKERGEAPDMAGTGHRFAHKIAVAPTARISTLTNETSPGVEPYVSNAYRHTLKYGSVNRTNKFLEQLLDSKNISKAEKKLFWSQVIGDKGSVQNTDILTDLEKEVFKTAFEIDQFSIVQQAAARQRFICQGQSINLFFSADAEPKQISKVHLAAWEGKLKGLYYLRSTSLTDGEKISKKVAREKLPESDCAMCDG